MLTGVELYLSATETCGWSDAEYQLGIRLKRAFDPGNALNPGKVVALRPPHPTGETTRALTDRLT